MVKLGRLSKRSLREIWSNEALDFTPWLAAPENLARLADTLGLAGLNLIDREAAVGPFSADLLCEDGMGETVVIENQIERSDHGHLGQVLTYLAGLNAKTVIWIAKNIREEHRAALDWLNANTLREFRFFGVEVEVWQIDDSAPAPRFEVIVRPNEWARSQRRESGSTDPNYQRRVDYWSAFLDQAPADLELGLPEKPPNQGWCYLRFESDDLIDGFQFNTGIYAFRHNAAREVGCYLSLGKFPEVNFDSWSAALPEKLRPEGGTWAVNQRGWWQLVVTTEADAMDEDDWRCQHVWMWKAAGLLLQLWRDGLKERVEALIRNDKKTAS